MGLDMYLTRMPRHNGATANDVTKVENFLDWIKAKLDGSEYAKCSLKEWCGCDKMPAQSDIEFYADYYKATYSDWDKEKEHPWWRIKEEVGYWRKANQIHNWFIQNCADRDECGDPIDDCRPIEITVDKLEELLEACKKVLADHSLASLLLPTQSGFFFGSTDYDEYYFEDIKNTIEIIEPVIKFAKHKLEIKDYVWEGWYQASW